MTLDKQKADGTVIDAYTYMYDAAHNQTKKTTAYGYDNNGNRLTVETNGQTMAVNTYDKKNLLIQTVTGSNTRRPDFVLHVQRPR